MPSPRRTAAAAILTALLSSCGTAPEAPREAPAERPPWADGRQIVTAARRNAGPQDLSNLSARILSLHNRERAAAGVPPLAWDAALAAAAASYGPALAAHGRLVHAPAASRPGQGENLWMGTAGSFALEEMIGSWSAEKRLFAPGAVPDVSRSGHFSDVGHYTQMIWRRTTRLGCALHRGRDDDYLICRYSPPGNVLGERVP
ncbi:MAG TPA: CAP domain-containing protein [Allosphingosinicella sp.]|nr:CAP domain-containing protein [Allosphingosinicella sp.]